MENKLEDTKISFCKDCEHCIPAKFLWFKTYENSVFKPLRCKRTIEKTINRVDGSIYYTGPNRCDFERYETLSHSCGQNGKFFVKREKVDETDITKIVYSV